MPQNPLCYPSWEWESNRRKLKYGSNFVIAQVPCWLLNKKSPRVCTEASVSARLLTHMRYWLAVRSRASHRAAWYTWTKCGSEARNTRGKGNCWWEFFSPPEGIFSSSVGFFSSPDVVPAPPRTNLSKRSTSSLPQPEMLESKPPTWEPRGESNYCN